MSHFLKLIRATTLLALHVAVAHAAPDRAATTVVLDNVAVKNLRIETVAAEETDFEETAFALGRIEARPSHVATVSSRISGRVLAIDAYAGDLVKSSAEVMRVESRQPGADAPIIPLTAPIEGRVAELNVHVGDPVEPDMVLMKIVDLSEVYAVARVPEHVAGRLKIGSRARIVVAAAQRSRFEGELLRFGTSADASTGTVEAVFRLANPEGFLRPGMRAEFSLVVAQRTGVLSVPRGALLGDATRRFVYVRDFEVPNALVKTPVVVGQINDQRAEIVSGLFPADEVVTRGAYSLSFAGGGSISLKEALDAAHGHAHAEDGSELTEEAKKKASTSASVHDGEHGYAEHGESALWKIVSAALFVLLLVALSWKRRPSTH